jgi:hypothetical protein
MTIWLICTITLYYLLTYSQCMLLGNSIAWVQSVVFPNFGYLILSLYAFVECWARRPIQAMER